MLNERIIKIYNFKNADINNYLNDSYNMFLNLISKHYGIEYFENHLSYYYLLKDKRPYCFRKLNNKVIRNKISNEYIERFYYDKINITKLLNEIKYIININNAEIKFYNNILNNPETTNINKLGKNNDENLNNNEQNNSKFIYKPKDIIKNIKSKINNNENNKEYINKIKDQKSDSGTYNYYIFINQNDKE